MRMHPRSWLFVPGNRPERFDKALNAGADATILDLEDAVPIADKSAARERVREWLSPEHPVYVRINAADTPWFTDDVAALAAHEGVAGLIVPKAENADMLRRASTGAHDELKLLPLIETTRAFRSLDEIAGAPRVERLLFGTIDFQVDTGIIGDGDELLYFRSQLTLASRLAGIGAPVDGVTTTLDDAAVVERETRRARCLGFRGKLCIHPKQIAAVHAAFACSSAEREWAQRVIDAANASGGAAVAVDGKMVDTPVILKAQEILAAASAD
jgi:citrate lyase subunit beta / citryl-CoA lyase